MLEILKRARELITDPEHWVQGNYTLDGPINASSTRCFCLVGAVDRAILEQKGMMDDPKWDDDDIIYEVENSPEGQDVLTHLKNLVGHDLIADFNDTHSHAEVLQLLDKAIENVGHR